VNALPREHGLIVSWVLTIAAALILSNQFHPFGIGLTIVLLPTLLVYDRLIVGMRLWSIGKVDLHRMLVEKVGAQALVLLLVALAYTATGLLLHLMPLIPVLVTASILLSEGVAFRYLRERHVVTRALSILTVNSQFLLINSALSGSVNSFEVAAFTLLSLVNLLLVADVVQQVETLRIPHEASGAGSFGVDLPFFVIGVGVATIISVAFSVYYLSFVALLIAVQIAFRYVVRGSSMRTIGVSSSVVEVLALLLLIVHFYAIL